MPGGGVGSESLSSLTLAGSSQFGGRVGNMPASWELIALAFFCFFLFEARLYTNICEGKFPISGMVVVAFSWSCAKAVVAANAMARTEKRILT